MNSIEYYKKYEPVFGTWSISREIGEGSFGKVFELERNEFGYTYKAALKAITIPQSQAEIDSALDDGMDDDSVSSYFHGFVEELIEEFRIMSKLKGESNIVSYEDHSVIPHSNGIGWDILIRMELLTPLPKYVKANGISRRDVIKLGIDICSALELCGRNKIIHRDIKPENIFISANGNYKLGDFGIAKTVEKTTGALSKKGTYTYMAPEVYRGDAYGASVDIYSLGIVLYRYLNNNRSPFMPDYPKPITHSSKETARARRLGGVPLPAPANADGDLSEVILKACAFKPEDRYSSPAEMKAALKALSVKTAANPRYDESVLAFSVGGAESSVISSTYVKTGASGTSTEGIDNEAPEGTTVMGAYSEPTVYGGTMTGTVVLEDDPGTVLLDSKTGIGGMAGIAIPPKSEKKKPKKKKRKGALVFSLIVLLAAVIFLLTRPGDDAPSPSESLKPDAKWSEWTDALPTSVNSGKYNIEEKHLYRQKTLEKKDSAEASLDGWELKGTHDGWSDYGGWSDWSQNAVSASDSRKVETKQQYRYRTISASGEKTWGDWSDWQSTAVYESPTTQVESRTLYEYYYFLCSNCGAHCSGTNMNCPTCHVGYLTDSDVYSFYDTTPHSGGWGWGAGAINVSGGQAYPGQKPDIVQYRYRTLGEAEQTYSAWSEYSDTPQTASASKEVETITLYRYCERVNGRVYSYERWSDWSDWSEQEITASDTVQVEVKTMYRYIEK